MFWRFGGYASISTIDTLLDKPEVTLEELLDESDLIQELKSHNTKLIEYLREDPVLEKLLEYVVAPKLAPVAVEEEGDDQDVKDWAKGKAREGPILSPVRHSEEEEDEKEKKRNKYAYVAAEILSSDSWSLSAALLENQALLRKFWDFLTISPPLDPLQASYFTKVNEALLDKKTEEMLELFKSIDGVVKNMLQHVDSPMVMDLLLKIISLEKAEGGQGIVDWLHSQDLMPILLSFLSSEHPWATQTSAGDFLKAIITISANASQNEQSCIGPNELTRQLVSQPCVEKLINDMLKGGNPLTVGVGIVIEVIRKNNSDYDPDVGSETIQAPSSRDPIYLGTLLRMFANHVPDFMELILSPNHTIGGGNGPVTIRRKELSAAFGNNIEPLGFDRFKTCELMAELLHCSNMGLLNEVGSEEFVKSRDVERERLKADGKLRLANGDRLSTGNEDLSMRSSTTSRLGSGSPDEFRKLEVQNASDDDGFEEVTHSGDLGDDTKDDFDEKHDLEEDILTPTQDTSLSFLDKDDDEFVDEPLSSPRLKPETDHFEMHTPDDPALVVMPLSPTKDLPEKFKVLGVDEDINIISPHSAADEAAGPVHETAALTADKESLRALEAAMEAHGKLAQITAKDGVAQHLQMSSDSLQQDTSLSPHPEDKPAPLFAKKSSESTSKSEIQPGTSRLLTSILTDAPGSTVADTDESSTPILTEASEDDPTLGAADDTQPIPVVGDYLKMQFVEHKVVPTILDFFFRFPWNNFLHNVVYDVVQQVFNGPMDRGYNRTLAIDLFDTGDITMRIVDGQKKSDEAQELNKMRLGYMGHLTLIAEEVVKFTERHPPELLSESVLEKVMNGEWITYVEVTLAETRERDNAILGGVRPDMAGGPRQAVMNAVNAATGFGGGGSSALAEAGLNGGSSLDGMDLSNGHGGGGFTLGGTSLLSGFGSSSDEEDEEMDEENDEESSRNAGGVEFSRYISTPSTTTATANTNSELDPPSAPPPPPPPLNIPPSRARRQLAARLALHSKQSAALAASNGGSLESEHRKNLNPFATDEDEDEDEQEDFSIGDLEVVAEGAGDIPAGTPLTSQQATLDELHLELEEKNRKDDYVGSLPSNTLARATFPFKWPFGQLNRSSNESEISASYREERERQRLASDDSVDDDMPAQFADRDHYRGNANVGAGQSSDESASDDSDEDVAFGATAKGKEKRTQSTTEATRRTSLEDEDDEEVVHVGSGAGVGAVDDGEIVEVRHEEVQSASSR